MSKIEKRALFGLLMFFMDFILIIIIDKIFGDNTIVCFVFMFLVFILNSILEIIFDYKIEKIGEE